MGKSKHVGNKHLYIGTSKNPKRMDTILEDTDKNIWKKSNDKIDNGTYNIQSVSYTLFCEGIKGKHGR